jgi:hypothetical protein
MHGYWRRATRIALALATVAGGFAAESRPIEAAEVVGGLQIHNSAVCFVRAGGHEGHRLNWEFKWYYPDTGGLGSNFTVGGTVRIQQHSPFDDSYHTVFEAPYGHGMTYGHVETRVGERRTRQPHFVYDRVRMETTWRIDETGQSGTVVENIACLVDPAPEGLEPIQSPVAPPDLQGGEPEDFEVFVHQADPSPHPLLDVSTWLFCEEERRQAGSNREVIWGTGLYNRGIGGDGVLVSGSIRISVRGPGGEYKVVSDEPFGNVVRANEEVNFQRNLFSSGLAAVKMEMFYRMSFGTQADPGQPERKVLRTTACE